MVVKWDTASKIIQVIGVVLAVITLAATLWPLLSGSADGRGMRASRTGRAVARGNSQATSGIVAPAAKSPGSATANGTGEADAADGGEATSGIRLE
jgi:hypothetical protein